MEKLQDYIRQETFSTYGNLCLIETLKRIGIEVNVNLHKGEAVAIFRYNQTSEYECLKRILNRRKVAVSA